VAGAARGSELVLEVVDAVLKLDEPADGGGGEALLGELDDPLELADLPAGVASLSPVGPPRVDQALALPATQRGWGDPEHVGDLGHRVERVVGVVGRQAPSLHAFMIPLKFREESCRSGNRFRAAPGYWWICQGSTVDTTSTTREVVRMLFRFDPFRVFDELSRGEFDGTLGITGNGMPTTGEPVKEAAGEPAREAVAA
jgi:hypothetical protein